MELDSGLLAIRARAREIATDLRGRALAVDAAPDRLDDHLGDLQAVREMARPGLRCLEAAVGLIELAWGDAGLVLACPGPGLAGVVVSLLGDEAQRAQLDAAVSGGRTWAFVAITEPGSGSDVAAMRTRLVPDGTDGADVADGIGGAHGSGAAGGSGGSGAAGAAGAAGGYVLNGEKLYIGNGARATIGVVFARTGDGPLAIRAALVRAPAAGLTATALDMIGLRGAAISRLRFDAVPVPPGALLGSHLRQVHRGMWGAIQAFNTVRVHVAALAVGTALAVHDYVRDARAWPRRDEAAALDRIGARIETVRRLTYRAAAAVDADSGDGSLASLAKLEAVALAQQACTRLPRLLGRGALLDHPLLEKWRRDCTAFEFMEGTSFIQRLNVTHGYLRTGLPGEEIAR